MLYSPLWSSWHTTVSWARNAASLRGSAAYPIYYNCYYSQSLRMHCNSNSNRSSQPACMRTCTITWQAAQLHLDPTLCARLRLGLCEWEKRLTIRVTLIAPPFGRCLHSALHSNEYGGRWAIGWVESVEEKLFFAVFPLLSPLVQRTSACTVKFIVSSSFVITMYRGRSDFSRFFSGEGAFPHQHQSLPDFYVITLWPLLLRSRAESRWKLASDASSPARLY